MIQDPAPYVATGIINVIGFYFSSLSTVWAFSRRRGAQYALFEFVILFSVSGIINFYLLQLYQNMAIILLFK